MKVFVTGATGFIGTAVVKELIAAGHEVLGMARSDAGAKSLAALGAEVHRGTLEDEDALRRGARTADATIHLAFVHDFSKFQENCALDGRAIAAMGSVLAGSNRPLIVTGGLGGLSAPGRLAAESDSIPPDFPFPRVSEQTALELKGVSAAVVRLPQVHDAEKQGLVTYLVSLAREKGLSAYVGEGRARWAAVHVSDAASAYRLALEKHEAGARHHAVAEEGLTLREIAEAIGASLGLPVKSLSPDEAAAHFGWLNMFTGLELSASSAITRRKLGWTPKGPGLIADLGRLAKTRS